MGKPLLGKSLQQGTGRGGVAAALGGVIIGAVTTVDHLFVVGIVRQVVISIYVAAL